MISEVTIEGLGPTEAAVLQLGQSDLMVVSGESECGKSTLLEAICFCLWGRSSDGSAFPVEAVRDGWEAATVIVRTAKGTEFKRVLSRSRAITRECQKGGETHRPTREDDWRALLGPLSDDVLGRAILVPFAWQALANGPGGGRPLRDLLARLLPPVDLRAIVAEQVEVHDGDSVDEKGVSAQRAEERKHAEQCRGKVSHLRGERDAAACAVPVGPSHAEVDEARTLLAVAEAWREHDAAKKLGAAAERWDAQLAALGPETPEPPVASPAEADAAHRAFEASGIRLAAAETALQRASKAFDKAQAGTCHACGQSLPEGAIGAAADALRAAELAVASAKEAHGAAGDARTRTRLAYEAACVTSRAWADTARRRKSLGQRPEAPAVVEPDLPQPTAAQVAAAKATISDAERAVGAAGEQDRRRARVAEQLAQAERDLSDSEGELRRLELLLDAVRRAPSVAARRQLDAIGDLGPVRIEFPEGDKADAIRVLLDGRPWWLASTGRQIVGDVWLRACIRRLARWPWMPIVVDRVQDVAGQDVPECRPAIWLRTCEGPLTVEDMP
jgi:hypothetical protein